MVFFESKTCQKSTLAGLLHPSGCVDVQSQHLPCQPAARSLSRALGILRNPVSPRPGSQAALGHSVNLPVNHWMLLRDPKTGRGGAFLSRISFHSCLAERWPFLSFHGCSLPVMLLRQPLAWGKHLQGCLLLLECTTRLSSNRSACLLLAKSNAFLRGWHLVPRPVSIHNISCPMPLLGGMLGKTECC